MRPIEATTIMQNVPFVITSSYTQNGKTYYSELKVAEVQTSIVSNKHGSVKIKWKKMPENVSGNKITYTVRDKSNWQIVRERVIYINDKKVTTDTISGLKAGKELNVHIVPYKILKGKKYYEDNAASWLSVDVK